MLYEKILIMGHTKEGKKFRPSDWQNDFITQLPSMAEMAELFLIHL